MIKFVRVACVILCLAAVSRLRADATTDPASQPGLTQLRIVVSAVQGHAQVKLASDSAWQAATKGMDLAVGCQIRTGVSGTVQFTVGDDEVYRVDRLSLIQVLRAEELNGKIKTDVGMTYGRVSKDVDAPVLPHDDTIVSPSATLAVRGTRVSLYDQPPYQPEAVSLTGAAQFNHFRGFPVTFGSHGGGKVMLAGTSTNPPRQAAGSRVVAPVLSPLALTDAENESLTNSGGEGGALPAGFGSLQVGASVVPMIQSPGGNENNGGNPPSVTRELDFLMSWGGPPSPPTGFTIVDLTVQSPLGEVVSFENQAVASGGKYNSSGSRVAGPGGAGSQSVTWPTSFPAGAYQVTETLVGTTTQTLAQDPGLQVTAKLGAQQFVSTSGSPTVETLTPMKTSNLNAGHPSVTYTVVAPLTSASVLVKH